MGKTKVVSGFVQIEEEGERTMKANTCKRLLALLACLAILCTVLAGCGGNNSGGGSASKDPAPSTSGGNEAGDSNSGSGAGGYKDIVVGLPEDITNLDPQESNASANRRPPPLRPGGEL